MQRTLLVSIVLVVACGGEAQPAKDVHVATLPPATATAAAPPRPHAPLGVPHGAPLVAAMDASAVLGLVGGARGEIEHELGLPQGSLAGDLADLGVDTSRPVTFCYAPLGAAGDALADWLAALAPHATPSDAPGVLARVGASHFMLATRLLVPATDASKLESTLRSLFPKAGWKTAPRGAFTRRHMVVRVVSDGSSVAVDLGAAREEAASPEALERLLSGPQDAPPTLDVATVRATWAPSGVAREGFLGGVSETVSAVSGTSLDANVRDGIVAQGLHEASGLFTLSGPKDKPFFDRVDVRFHATPLRIDVRAQPGAGFAMPADAAFAPSFGAAVDGAKADVSVARAFFDAWHLPPDAPRVFREAGRTAFFVALPQVLAVAPAEIPELMHLAGPTGDVARHFERVGEAWDAQHQETWVGVLPPKTSRAAALCSLSATERCAAKDRLTLGKAEKKGHGWAKLVVLDRRYVLLLARDAAPLSAHVQARATTGPLHFEARLKDLLPSIGSMSLPDRVVGDVTRDGGALLFHVAAP